MTYLLKLGIPVSTKNGKKPYRYPKFNLAAVYRVAVVSASTCHDFFRYREVLSYTAKVIPLPGPTHKQRAASPLPNAEMPSSAIIRRKHCEMVKYFCSEPELCVMNRVLITSNGFVRDAAITPTRTPIPVASIVEGTGRPVVRWSQSLLSENKLNWIAVNGTSRNIVGQKPDINP